MSKAVKERRAEQRLNPSPEKLANQMKHAVTLLQQAKAKNNPIEKARQEFWRERAFVDFGKIYEKQD